MVGNKFLLKDKLKPCRLAPYIIIRDSLHLKRSLTDKNRSILRSSSSTMDQTNKEEQVHQGKKNYLLAEFESVLTEISKQ